MRVRMVNCPSCGSPVEFRVSSSRVTVCPYCQSVVARSDKEMKDYGKVADLVLTNSPLAIGMSGRFNGLKFDVVGRVQYKHPAGGVWNEWYLSFTAGKWGWLAEAQGKLYLLVQKNLGEKESIPPLEELRVGLPVNLGFKESFTVREVGTAVTGAAEGEIPWVFKPGIPHLFADLEGDKKAFASIDYNKNPPRIFVGEEVTASELHLPDIAAYVSGFGTGNSKFGETENTIIRGTTVNCPNCAGPLKLFAPDQAERVTCPNCNSLLDCQSGKLEFLQTLKTRKTKIVIPLGTQGKIGDQEYIVIGFMERFAMYEGKSFPWTEYLLYQPKIGFRWLVHNEQHWSFVEPISIHGKSSSAKTITHEKQQYKVYDRGEAFVKYVVGEFYWKVTLGEKVRTADFICPPKMISFEWTENESGTGTGEVNVSLGTYMKPEEIEQAFGLENISRPWSVGVIQPAPTMMPIYQLWGLMLVLMFILNGLLQQVWSKPVDIGYFIIMLVLQSVIPLGAMFYQQNNEVNRWQNSDYSPYASE